MGVCLPIYIRVAVMFSLAVLLDIQLPDGGHAPTGFRYRPDGIVKHVVAGPEMVDVGPKSWILFPEL